MWIEQRVLGLLTPCGELFLQLGEYAGVLRVVVRSGGVRMILREKVAAPFGGAIAEKGLQGAACEAGHGRCCGGGQQGRHEVYGGDEFLPHLRFGVTRPAQNERNTQATLVTGAFASEKIRAMIARVVPARR